MSSVTNSLTNTRPLWISKFMPMNSGTMVQSRDQVLIGLRSPDADCRSTLPISRASTYGPFFSERLIVHSSPSFPVVRVGKSLFYEPRRRAASGKRWKSVDEAGRFVYGRAVGQLRVVRAGPAAADDRRVRRLALRAGLAALGQDAGGAARVAAAGGAALAAAHRVADRVHRGAAVVRLAAHVPLPAGLAQADVHVVGVADGADRRPALDRHPPHL